MSTYPLGAVGTPVIGATTCGREVGIPLGIVRVFVCSPFDVGDASTKMEDPTQSDEDASSPVVDVVDVVVGPGGVDVVT